jgi:hypothetical protein
LSRAADKKTAPSMGDSEVLRSASYTKAAEEIRVSAERECHAAAKELLLDIERSFQRLAEIARFSDELKQDRRYDRPFAHFGFFRGNRSSAAPF